jgi:antitoxin component YwqK of YwqJK toxin-antitoxin module
MLTYAQEKVHVSEIEERNIDGKTILYAHEIQYNGIVYENYSSPKLKYTVQNGVKNGPYEVYYRNGQINRKTSFKDDKYDGAYEEYYENGQL